MQHAGSFGLFKQRYVIGGDGVTITRNVWLPFVLLALMVVGGVVVYAGVTRNADPVLLAVGGVLVVPGIIAAGFTPWLAPGRIRCSTPDGLVWGNRTIPSAEIRDVRPIAVTVPGANHQTQQAWEITIHLVDRSSLSLSLGTHPANASSDAMMALAQAMKLALHAT
jgi:hypothetical protein